MFENVDTSDHNIVRSLTMSDVLSLSHITELAQSFERAKVLLAAVELDLFTALADRPLDRDALRERIGIDERGARDFFDALVAPGVVGPRSGRTICKHWGDQHISRPRQAELYRSPDGGP